MRSTAFTLKTYYQLIRGNVSEEKTLLEMNEDIAQLKKGERAVIGGLKFLCI